MTFSDDLATAALLTKRMKSRGRKYEDSGFTEKRCDVAWF